MYYSYPNIMLHFQGNPRIKCDTIPTVIISAVHGRNARRRTAHDNFLNFTISSPSPARVNITVRASFLKKITEKYFIILHFIFLFSLFVFVSAAGHYFRIWTVQEPALF